MELLDLLKSLVFSLYRFLYVFFQSFYHFGGKRALREAANKPDLLLSLLSWLFVVTKADKRLKQKCEAMLHFGILSLFSGDCETNESVKCFLFALATWVIQEESAS